MKAIVWIFPIALAACTPSSKTETLQKIPFEGFRYTEATEVTLLKNDPASSDQWQVRLQPSALQKEGDGTPLWEFNESTVPWIDRLVDRAFVLHLLDTLSTLQVVSPAQTGPLASFGLAPPFFAIRWKTANQAADAEIQLGQFTRSPDGRFALLRGQIVVIQGAVLQMLGQIQNVQRLRRQLLLTWSPDEVDVIRWKNRGQVFVAERRSDGWLESGLKKTARPVEEWLQALFHLRVDQFIDDVSETSTRLNRLRKNPDFVLSFEGRNQRKLEMKAQAQDGRVFVWVSSRPAAVFQLHLDSLRHLPLPKR